MKWHFLAIFLFFLSFFCLGTNTFIIAQSNTKNALLVLDSRSFENQNTIQIKGEVFFVWKKFLTPSEVITSLEKELVKFPAVWNDYLYKGEKIGSKGYATYAFKVVMPKGKRRILGIELNTIATAYKFYIEDSLINEVGKVGKNSKQNIPLFKYKIYQIPDFQKDTLLFTFQVANLHTKNGGFWRSPVIGKYEYLIQQKNWRVQTDFFLLGSLFIIALYHFGLFFYRTNDRSTLYFAVFCLIIGIRVLTLSHFNLADYWTWYSWEIREKSSYLTFSLGVLFFMMFTHSIFPKDYPDWLFKFLQYLTILFSVFVLFTPNRINAHFLIFIQLLSIFIVLLGLVFLVNAIRKKYESAWLFLIGVLIIFTAMVNDILYSRMIINTGYIFPWGLFLFILNESIMLSIRFAKAFYRAEALSMELNLVNQNLELLVLERTQSLKEISEDLKVKNKNITDSINYAKKIQEAFLPSAIKIKELLPTSFILFRPLATVSGDFYWADKVGDRIIVAVADCTGHGVPGAFMSLIAESFLRQIVVLQKIYSPKNILQSLNQYIYEALQQKENQNTDGMDIGICVLDLQKETLEFAGARNGLLLIQNNEYSFVKADRFSLGGTNERFDFKEHTIVLKKNTYFYLFSDGFQDQFGGKYNKKIMRKKLHQLIFENHNKSMEIQKQKLIHFLDEWMEIGKETQVDDITILGVKL